MFRNLLVLSVVLFLLTACSSGTDSILPMMDEDSSADILTSQTQMSGGRGLLGLYQWEINLRDETISATPLRSPQLHYNVVTDMNFEPPGIDFEGFLINKPDQTISLDVHLYHPYPSRPNLAGFDVHGIMIGSGSVTGFNDDTIRMAGLTDARILNPDGWTRWWNPSEFNIGDDLFSYTDGDLGIANSIGNYNATLNGYKTFASDLGNMESVTNLHLPDRLIFTTQATHTRHYDIWFPVEDDQWILRYNYAIDVSWEPIPGYQNGDEVDIPTDWEANANQEEPFMVIVDEIQNSLYFETESIKGGNAVVNVKVFDWQGYLDDGSVADEIESVMFENPLNYDGVEFAALVDPGDNGLPYATYELTLEGDKVFSAGPMDGLFTIVSANGGYQSSVTGYTGTSPLAYYTFAEIGLISTEFIPLNEPPTALAALLTMDPIYVGDVVEFDASASSDPEDSELVYEWDFDNNGIFGDGYYDGSDVNPKAIFAWTGEFFVDLKVTDVDGASDTLDEKLHITVLPDENIPPVAIAFALNNEIEITDPAEFSGVCSYDPDGSVVSWEWDFDNDGVFGDPFDSGTDKMPVKYFATGGVYQINLRVIDDLGAEDTLGIEEIIVIDVIDPENISPMAIGYALDSEIEITEPAEFNGASSYDPDGVIVSWEWDFDNDGVFGDLYDGGTDQMPVKYFATGGEFQVNLMVTDDLGAEDTLGIEEIIIIDVIDPENISPIAIGYAFDNEIDISEPAEFNGASSYDPDGTIVSWEWDFDNDGLFGDLYDSGTDEMPLKYFAASGEYHVNLKVTDNLGAQDTLELEEIIVINVIDPENSFPFAIAYALDNEIEILEPAEFNGTYSYDPDGFIVSWEWDFDNDGVFGDLFDSGTEQMPVKYFSPGGEYQVNLRVTDNLGAEDTLELDEIIIIEVLDPQNLAPVAVATVDQLEVIIGQCSNFNGAYSYDPDGTVVSWEWDFDGDNVYGDAYNAGTDQLPQFCFEAIGVYVVDLKVTDSGGASDTLDAKLIIDVVEDPNPENILPVAIAWAFDVMIEEGQYATFTALDSYDPDGIIVSYEWDFNNDGVFGDSYDKGSDTIPQKLYPSPGTYYTSLKVTDNDGGVDITDQPVVITVVENSNLPPVAVASVCLSWAHVGHPIFFHGGDSYDPDGEIVLWQWDFDGDGIYGDSYFFGCDVHPWVKYWSSGVYYADLKVTDDDGAVDYLDEPLEITIF